MSETVSDRRPIIVREEKRFCRSPQFSLEFPKRLIGIINPTDFQQSINNINCASRPTLTEKLVILFLFLISLIGLLTFIFGIVIKYIFGSSLWVPLMSVGFGTFLGFLVIAIFVSSQIHRVCDTRLDQAIENQTKKYSTNLPVPIRWRLDMTIYTRRLSAAAPTDIQYYLLIDIGQNFDTESTNSQSNLSRLAVPTDSRYPSIHSV